MGSICGLGGGGGWWVGVSGAGLRGSALSTGDP